MLILAEGTASHSLEGDAHCGSSLARADGGRRVCRGRVRERGGRPGVDLAVQPGSALGPGERLNDLPVVRDGVVGFATTVVTKLRYR